MTMKTTSEPCPPDGASMAFSAGNRLVVKMLALFTMLVAAIGVSFGQTTQTYNTNGTFTVPAGVTSVQVEAWGGGGAGGGVDGTLASNRAGGGGGGGAYRKTLNVAVTPGQVISVTVGQGGTPVSGGNGGAGGTSIFASGAPVTAPGGGGGLAGNGSDSTGEGGAGGVGTINGGKGGTATTGIASSTSGGGGGGAGNGTAGGNAGTAPNAGTGGGGTIPGGSGATGRTDNGNGAPATALSGGGAGGRNSFANTDRLGGAGFPGRVIVTYTCPTYALTSTSANGPFCGNSAATVTVNAPLSDGTYTITYNLSGATSGTGINASVAISGGTGTFNTSLLSPGTTNVTITAITSSYCTSTVNANNSASVTVVAPATANAGTPVAICASTTSINVTAGATATNHAGLLWTSSGTGSFTNETSLTDAVYFPSVDDIAAGSVTLTLTASGNAPCNNAVANKILTINQAPSASAGGTDTICSNGTATVSGASASNGSILWTENGPGSLTNANTLTPTYTPVAGENGTVTLTMTVSNAGCTNASATYTVNVVAAPTVAAGANFAMCSDLGSVNVTGGATASNFSSVVWTSSGTGTFDNADSLTLATYTPSAGDIAAGSVVLTLTANGNTPCASTTSNKTLSIMSPPTATAGGSQTICQNQTATVSGATAANGTILWTENGAGSITAGANTLTPTYTAAAGDAGNTVTLTMTVSNAPCSSATATYTINVLALPTANAGTAVSVCSNDSVNVTAGASATNTDGVLWTSSGSGSFTDADSLTGAVYTPSQADINAGSVTLTLTVSGNGSCNSATSTKTLTIKPIPVTTGAVICQNSPVTISSSVCTNPPASMQKFPTAGATVGSGTAWSSPANVVSENNSYASISALGNTVTSRNLQGTGFGFTIPANATIVGIQAGISRFLSITGIFGPTGSANDVSVRLIKGGAIVGSEKASGAQWPTSEALATYGGSSDLWGTTWTPAEINASNFGLNLVATTTASQITTAQVDYFVITVTYTTPGTTTWYTVSSGGTAIGTGLTFNPVGVANSPLPNTSVPGTYKFYAECSTVPGCRAETTIVINPLPEVSFTGLDALYCQDAPAAALTGNHAGGTFSGPGVTSNGNGTGSFNAATAGVGNHTVTYTFTDGNSCVNSVSHIVAVNANVTYYADADGDGFGNISVSQVSCTGAPSGYVANNTDCDDTDNTKNSVFAFYVDADNDGFGAGSLVSVCAVNAGTPPAGYSLNATDCNDADPTKNTTFEFYTDADNDGYGMGGLVSVCAVDASTPPMGYSLNNTDCDDTNATMHESFEFYVDADGDGYGTGELVVVCAVDANTPPTGYSLNNTDCNDAARAINPGHAEVLYNGVDDNCDGQLDEGFQHTTQIQPAQCGTTLSTISSLVSAVSKNNSTGYRFEVTNTATNAIQIIDRPLNWFSLTMLPSYDYATTYSIRCEIQRNGIWMGYYGPACLVSTPAVLDPGGAAQVSASQCGITLPTIKTLIATNSIPNTTMYRFRITNLTDASAPNQVQILDRTLHWFSLTMLPTYCYGTTYMIEVAIKTNGEFSGFGSPCTVNTPEVPALTPCGGVVPYSNTLVSTLNRVNVTSYRFEITNMNTNIVTTLDRPINWFKFNMVPNYEPGGSYGVRVALMTNGVYSPFGDACEITAPGTARPELVKAEIANAFDAVIYPNPFAETFAVGLTTSAESDVNIKVYDMTGRMLEQMNVKASDLESATFGERYPAGVYNVIISQDENTRSLRIIKR